MIRPEGNWIGDRDLVGTGNATRGPASNCLTVNMPLNDCILQYSYAPLVEKFRLRYDLGIYKMNSNVR